MDPQQSLVLKEIHAIGAETTVQLFRLVINGLAKERTGIHSNFNMIQLQGEALIFRNSDSSNQLTQLETSKLTLTSIMLLLWMDLWE